MKATKFIAVIAFAAFGFCAEGALAQGNEQTESTEQAAPPVTDETVPAGEETESYNETVTIDSSETAPATTSESGFTDQAERKEKLRVYSGKHDGNNVITDPR